LLLLLHNLQLLIFFQLSTTHNPFTKLNSVHYSKSLKSWSLPDELVDKSQLVVSTGRMQFLQYLKNSGVLELTEFAGFRNSSGCYVGEWGDYS